MAARYALTDEQCARIEPLLPGRACSVGFTARDNRLFVDAVLYRYRACIPWLDLPERFGHFREVHRCHSRWWKKGTCERVFEALAGDRDNEYAMIDSSIVRAHQRSAGTAGSEKKPRRSAARAGDCGVHGRGWSSRWRGAAPRW